MLVNKHGNWKTKVCPKNLNGNIFFLITFMMKAS